MAKVLIITGDGGESYEALYAVHRFEEEGWEAVVAAPSAPAFEPRDARLQARLGHVHRAAAATAWKPMSRSPT